MKWYIVFILFPLLTDKIQGQYNVPQWEVRLQIHFYHDLVGEFMYKYDENIADMIHNVMKELTRDANAYFNRNSKGFRKIITLVHNRNNMFLRQFFLPSEKQNILPILEEYCSFVKYQKTNSELTGRLNVLLTTMDLYNYTSDGKHIVTKGHAYLGNICDEKFGCAIMKYDMKRTIAENAFVLARLVARSMGAEYDGDNECDPVIYFMNHKFEYTSRNLDWSICSTYEINTFMSTNISLCVKRVNKPLPSIADY